MDKSKSFDFSDTVEIASLEERTFFCPDINPGYEVGSNERYVLICSFENHGVKQSALLIVIH